MDFIITNNMKGGFMLIIKKIYEEYKKDVFVYLVSLTNDTCLSEDLVSETFLSAIKSIHRFKGESSIKTWLFSIARNKWYEYLRKEKLTTSLDDLTYHYIVSELDLEEKLIQKDISNKILYLLADESNTTTSNGRMVIRIMTSVSQNEIEKCSERTKIGLAGSIKQGHLPSKTTLVIKS